MGLCETLFEGYKFEYKPPTDCTKGGIGVYYKENLESGMIIRDLNKDNLPGIENLWLEFKEPLSIFDCEYQ